jgi:hypothetical protein
MATGGWQRGRPEQPTKVRAPRGGGDLIVQKFNGPGGGFLSGGTFEACRECLNQRLTVASGVRRHAGAKFGLYEDR